MSIAYDQMAQRLTPHQGDWLRKALEVGGVTAKDMAETLDVHPRTITNYLGGHTAPKRSYLTKWALRTGVPIEYLETGTLPTDGGGGGKSSTLDYRGVVSYLNDYRKPKAA